MVQAVALPDGNLVNFPDEMSHEDIAKAMPEVYHQYQNKQIQDFQAGNRDIIATGAKASLSNLGKNVSNAIGLGNSQDDAETARLNQELANKVQTQNIKSGTFLGIGAGDISSFLGEAAPAAAMGVATGGAGSVLGEAAGAAIGGERAASIGSWLGSTEAAGAGATATAQGDVKENLKTSLWASPLIDLAVKTPGAFLGGVKNLWSNFTGAGKAFEIGENLEKSASPEGLQKLKQYTSTPENQQPYNLPTAAVTTDPTFANLQNKVEGVQWDENGATITPANQINQTKTDTLTQLGQNLGLIKPENANPEGLGQVSEQEASNTIESTNKALEQAKTGLSEAAIGLGESGTRIAGATEVDPLTGKPITPTEADKSQGGHFLNAIDQNRIQERQLYNNITASNPNATVFTSQVSQTAYDIAKDEDVNSLLLDRNGNRIMQKYVPSKMPAGTDVTEFNPETAANAPKVKVQSMLQDIADLNAIKSQYQASMQNPLNANKGLTQRVLKAADTAKNVIEQTLNDTEFGPAYQEAKQTVKANNEALFRNPNVTRTSVEGVPSMNDSQFAKLKTQYLSGEPVSRVKVGESIYNPGEAEDALANVKNTPNGPELFKQQALSRIVDSLGDKPTLANFDKAFPEDIQRAMKANGLDSQLKDILNLRDDLSKSEGNLNAQQAALEGVEASNKEARNSLEKSTARQFLNDNYKAIPTSQQVNKILSDEQLRNDVIAKASQLNDGGATLRGIGQNILEKIANDSTDRNGILNAEKLNDLLDKHSDILSQTLDKKALDAVKEIGQVADQVEFSSNFGKGGKELTQAQEPLNKALGVEIGTKLLKAGPPSVVGHGFLGMKNFSEIAYYKVLNKVVQNPYYAQSLIEKAGQNPYTFQGWMNNLLRNNAGLNAGEGAIIRGINNNKDNNNVQPQSNNSPVGATSNALTSARGESFLDRLGGAVNPISDAEASEIKANPASKIFENVRDFQASRDGPALTNAMKKYGVNATEMMTLVNAESSVKNGGNGYAQMTPSAWHQSEQLLGRKLNRKNADDYAEASVVYYKWTANQVKNMLNIGGTPSVKDVYPAYNAGVSGYHALLTSPPNSRSIDAVPASVSSNNPYFYYNKDGSAKTVKQTLNTYSSFIKKKMEEYSPTKHSTTMALASASSRYNDNEPDMQPRGD